MVSAATGEAINEGEDRTREIITDARDNAPHLVVAIAKMDKADWSETRFAELANATLHTNKTIVPVTFNHFNMASVPASGLKQANLFEQCPDMPWFKDWKTKEPEGKMLRQVIQDVRHLRERFVANKE